MGECDQEWHEAAGGPRPPSRPSNFAVIATGQGGWGEPIPESRRIPTLDPPMGSPPRLLPYPPMTGGSRGDSP